jgi:hypothetical protein
MQIIRVKELLKTRKSRLGSIQTDGTRIIAVQRMDLDMAKDPKARELALADNRAGELNLEWAGNVLLELGKDIDLSGPGLKMFPRPARQGRISRRGISLCSGPVRSSDNRIRSFGKPRGLFFAYSRRFQMDDSLDRRRFRDLSQN